MNIDNAISRAIETAQTKASRIIDNGKVERQVLTDLKQRAAVDTDREWQLMRHRLHRKSARYRWLKWSTAAAAVIISAAVTFAVLDVNNNTPRPEYAILDSRTVLPGHRSAVIMVGNDTLRMTESTDLSISQGSITLSNRHERTQTTRRTAGTGTIVVTTPRGCETTFRMEDGTTISLNSDSRITLRPTGNSRQRRVSLEGEAYFEVAKNATRPFYVELDGMQVHVTGTAFNVNARHGGTVAVTLLEGSVRIERSDGTLLATLRPGEQFNGSAGGRQFGITRADTDAALAWHRGEFVFKDTRLDDIARQLSLWYNIDITVPPALAGRRYSGELNRRGSLEPLLKVLRLTGEMEFIDRGDGHVEIIKTGKHQ